MTLNKKKSSILLIGSQMTTGGSQSILLILSKWLHENGYPVKLVFFHDEDGLHEKWQTQFSFPIINLKAWEKRSQSVRKYFMLVRGLIRLFQIMRLDNVSSVMTFTHHSNLLGIPIAWINGIPVRIAAHRGRIHGFPRWQEKIHSWMINSGMATKLVAISKQIGKDAVSEGVNPEKILVIPNGVEPLDFDPSVRVKKRNELKIKPDQFVVLSVGRLSYEKGHDVLIGAVPTVVQEYPQTVFIFSGDGPQRSALENQVDTLDIRQNVFFLGVRTDVRELITAAELFVFPSRSEGLGQALLEAMSVGITVVASNVGGIPEVIENGKSGVLVTPEKSHAFAQAIIEMLGNEQQRKIFSSAARETVREKYPIQKMFDSYLKILDPSTSGQ